MCGGFDLKTAEHSSLEPGIASNIQRIALITGSILPAIGGIEWNAHYLATEYVKKGHEVTAFTIRPPAELKSKPLMVEPSYALVRCGAQARGMGRLGINVWLFCR